MLRTNRIALVAFALATACSTSSPLEVHSDIVTPGSPWVAPGHATGAMPRVGAGTLPEGTGAPTDPTSAHDASYTAGNDVGLAQIGDALATDAGSPSAAWLAEATMIPFASSPDFPTLLNQALADANSYASGHYNHDSLKLLLTVIEQVGGEAKVWQELQRLVAWPTERSRWLTASTTSSRFTQFGQSYADPSAFAETRQRGARLFCAAREARRRQGGSNGQMGRASALSVKVFGKQIDFLTVTPSVLLDDPKRYLGGAPAPNDGAQAFMIPMQYGVAVEPISLLPPLPEFRYPVTLVTGDSEVRADALTSTLTTRTTKSYVTATHADSLVTREGGGSAGTTTTLFYIGPVAINLNVGFGMGIGQVNGTGMACSTTPSPDGDGNAPFPAFDGAMSDDRVLAYSLKPVRSGDRVGAFNDAPWLMYTTYPVTAPVAITATPTNGPSASLTLPPYDPMLTRAFGNDDRHLPQSVSLGVCAGISGSLPNALPSVFDIQLTAGGSMLATGSLVHDLRDGVDIAARLPQDTLTIAPHLAADLTANLFVHLKIVVHIGVGFLGLNEDVTIYDDNVVNPKLDIARYQQQPWDDQYRLRLGTGSDGRDPLGQPSTISHLPSKDPGVLPAAFDAFDNQTVDSCLRTDPPANPPLPPPCKPQGNPTTAPHVNLCAYVGGSDGERGIPYSWPANVCSNIAGYVNGVAGATQAQRDCLTQLLQFSCAPTSQEQSYQGISYVVARVFDVQNQAQAKALVDVTNTCIAANVSDAGDHTTNLVNAKRYASGLFHYAMCDGAATLVDPKDVLTTNGGGPGPVGPPAACQ